MDEESQGIDLSRHVGLVLRWWWIIAAGVILFAALAYIYSTATKSTVYTAEATILIQESRSGLAPGFGDIQASQELTRTYQELLTTSHVLRMVLDELGLPDGPEDLRDQVNVSIRTGTPLMDVEVRRGDPDSPASIANTLAQVFIQDRQTTRLGEIRRLELAAEAQGIDTTALRESQLSTLGSISVIEEASIVKSFVTPSIRKNMLLAGLLGLFLGVLLAFFADYSSNKISSVEQIDKLVQSSNLPPSILGVVFQWNPKEIPEASLVVQSHPESVYSEMFRQVRTGFQFAASGVPGKAFMVTSVGPQEGKSTILANLGAVLAQGGNKVVLVDTDLRRPSLHRFLGIDRRRGGLTTLIADSQKTPTQILDTATPGLRVIASGPIPTNPADLIGSSKVDQIIEDLKDESDVVLLDSPPVMAAADAMILSAKVDGVILVVTMGETRGDTFRDVLVQVQRSGTPVLGYVVNKMKGRGIGYGRYRYRYHYYSRYKSDEDAELDGASRNGSESSNGTSKAAKLRNRIAQLLRLGGH